MDEYRSFSERYSIGRWMNIDPLANDIAQISASPFAYANNSPILYYDPDGRKWKSTKDENEAEGLKDESKEKIAGYTQDIVKVGEDITALENSDANKDSKSYKKELKKLKQKGSNAKASIGEINSFIGEVDALGSDENNTFTFNDLPSSSNEGFIGKDFSGAITINHLSGIGNKAHETRHAFQFMNGDLEFNKKRNPMANRRALHMGNKNLLEVKSYRIQFALDPNSMGDVDGPKPVHINFVRKWYLENVPKH